MAFSHLHGVCTLRLTGSQADPQDHPGRHPTSGLISVQVALLDLMPPDQLRQTDSLVPVHVIAEARRPGTAETRRTMKPDIHPAYGETQVTCTCGNTFTTKSTAPNGVLHADVCSACHPFYTGKQKILDTGGRVARFEKRYAQKTAAKKSGR
jgi:large subunit ribosomal protein L31